MPRSLRTLAISALLLVPIACSNKSFIGANAHPPELTSQNPSKTVARLDGSEVKNETVVALIVDAYGGEQLQDLRSFRLRDEGLYSEYKYGFTPDFYEYDRQSIDLEVDLKAERGSYDYRVTGDRFAYHNRNVTMGEKIVSVSYALKSYETDAYPSFLSAFGAPMRRSDTMIAWWIAQSTDKFDVTGTSRYLGRDHIVGTFELPGLSAAELHIDAKTGFITRMDRKLGDNEKLTYLWSDHKHADGIAYGSLFQIHFNDHLEAVVTDRQIEPNRDMMNAYDINPSIVQEPDRTDANITSHKVLSDNVFLSGMDGSYSLFVNAGDYIIAAGTTGGFKDRYEHFSESSGIDKPLRYVIATQHAAKHIEGLIEASVLGATIVIPRPHISTIKDFLFSDSDGVKFEALDKFLSLGPVEIHDITTTHADHIPLVYIPEIKVIYQADSYGNSYVDAPGFAGIGGVTLKNEIDRLGLDVREILFIYNPESGRYSDFEKAVENFIPRPCFEKRDICKP